MCWLLILAFVLLQDLLFILGDMTLRELEPRIYSAIECVSPNDTTILFRDMLNTTRVVAECDTSLKACFLKEQVLAQYYTVFYDEFRTIVRILNGTDKTSGVYTCCETYNSKNCASIVIMDLAGNLSEEMPNTDTDATSNCSSTMCTAKGIEEMRTYIVGVTVLTAVSLTLIMVLLTALFLERGQKCKPKKLKYVQPEDWEEQLANEICMLIKQKQLGPQSGRSADEKSVDSANDDTYCSQTRCYVFQSIQSRWPFSAREHVSRETHDWLGET